MGHEIEIMREERFLNVGCGKAKIHGFINIDVNRDADVTLDVRHGLPYEDNTVDGIYSEHFIEHLTQTEIIRFLRECRRVLKPGGRIRIATPDLDEIVRHYYTNTWRQPWLLKYGYEWICNRAEYLNVSLREWDHLWVVNEEELVRLALWAGFDQYERCKPGYSSEVRFLNLETRAESTLVIEFIKTTITIPQEPLITIVIPAYRPDFFKQCIDSALSQTYKHFEVLILDDSRCFTIHSIISRHYKNLPQIIYHRNNISLGEADNFTQGIHLANGYFIKPLHDDDKLHPQALQWLVDAFRSHPECTLAVGATQKIDEQGNLVPRGLLDRPLARTSCRLDGTRMIELVLSGVKNHLGEPTSMMFRRRDALLIKEPNVMSLFGRLCFGIGDVCLAMHLLSRGNLAYVADPVAQIRIHSGQTQRIENSRQTALSTWLYIKRQGLRLGFDVSKFSLLMTKLILRCPQLYILAKIHSTLATLREHYNI